MTDAAHLPYLLVMSYERSLLILAEQYVQAHDGERGRSLARVATLIVNRGSFFEALERGGTCSARNLAKLVEFFGDTENWSSSTIPPAAKLALQRLGYQAERIV